MAMGVNGCTAYRINPCLGILEATNALRSQRRSYAMVAEALLNTPLVTFKD